MTNQEMQKTMQFIIEQQAQFVEGNRVLVSRNSGGFEGFFGDLASDALTTVEDINEYEMIVRPAGDEAESLLL